MAACLMALKQQEEIFYKPCNHCQGTRILSYFCTGCREAYVYCERCKNFSSYHGGHDYFQVFKPSYRLGVRIHDMQGLFDVSDIRSHTHNGDAIVYVNLRNQCGCRREGGSITRYCSIHCKVEAEGYGQSAYDHFGEAAAVRTSHRKGVPHRSPFY